MKVFTPKFSLTIADRAINNLAENPFKFPKPNSVQPRITLDDGSVKPNVSFLSMMEFLYSECMQHILKKFKQNMLETFDKLAEGEVNIQTFTCGNTTFKRSVYMYPWDIQCNIVSLNANLTITDIDLIISELKTGKHMVLDKDFALEITSAELKYHVKKEPLHVKGNDLTTQRTK